MYRSLLAGLCLFALATPSQAVEVVCAQLVSTPEGRIIGWTLLQPTEGLGAVSNHFPSRMNVAFSKDNRLVISDDLRTVTVDPQRPSQPQYAANDAGRILLVNSPNSVVVATRSGQLQAWGLRESQLAAGSPAIYQKTNAPKFDGNPSFNILGYQGGPEEKIAYLLARSEDGRVKYSVALAKNIGGRLEVFYEYELPALDEKAQAFINVNDTLTKIVYGKVESELVTLIVKPVGSSLPMEKRLAHPFQRDFSQGPRMSYLPLTDTGKALLLGGLLVTNPLERIDSKVFEVGEDPGAHKTAAFSSDGKVLAYHEQGKALALIDPKNGEIKQTVALNGFVRLAQLEFSPDGEHLAVVGYSYYPRNAHNRSQLQILKVSALQP